MSKRMGSLGKLSDFGKTSAASQPTAPKSLSEVETKPLAPSTQEPTTEAEKQVTVNIKITRSQQEWLADTARQVRDNNTAPVPPGDRVYPQHLIGVAIEMLRAADVDWSQVQNVADLKQFLKF